jgi:hypothetical protein
MFVIDWCDKEISKKCFAKRLESEFSGKLILGQFWQLQLVDSRTQTVSKGIEKKLVF